MKQVFSLIAFLLISFCTSHAQTISSIKSELLQNNQNEFGKIIKRELKNDSLYVELSTYGHCNTTFQVDIKHLESGVIGLLITDLNENNQAESTSCAGMHKISFVATDLPFTTIKNGIAISNKVLTTETWQNWYWEHKE